LTKLFGSQHVRQGSSFGYAQAALAAHHLQRTRTLTEGFYTITLQRKGGREGAPAAKGLDCASAEDKKATDKEKNKVKEENLFDNMPSSI
jgi:hypothetical protein